LRSTRRHSAYGFLYLGPHREIGKFGTGPSSGQIPFGEIASPLQKERISIAAAFAAGYGGDALGLASGTGLRSRKFVSADGATVSVQDGNTPKHMHLNANEMQYILEGTGTIWLGDKEVRVKPGDLIVISKGTAHGGTKPDGRPFKSIAIRTPSQAPDDTKLLD
jgi:mannose-6-phosphate isomerase-like protein (cupin superfamily)